MKYLFVTVMVATLFSIFAGPSEAQQNAFDLPPVLSLPPGMINLGQTQPNPNALKGLDIPSTGTLGVPVYVWTIPFDPSGEFQQGLLYYLYSQLGMTAGIVRAPKSNRVPSANERLISLRVQASETTTTLVSITSFSVEISLREPARLDHRESPVASVFSWYRGVAGTVPRADLEKAVKVASAYLVGVFEKDLMEATPTFYGSTAPGGLRGYRR